MKQCKLLIALLLAVLCLFACAAAEEPVEYTSGDYRYVLLEDGTAKITRYTGTAETLDVPEVLDGYRVTGIGDYAFFYCESLTSIIFVFNDCCNPPTFVVTPRCIALGNVVEN